MDRRRLHAGLPVLLLLAGGFYAVFIGRTAFIADGGVHFTLIDDAMISMRYAQHLAEGIGLVWNPGEAPVQGFSNPGWVFLMALFHMLPLTQSTMSLGVMVAAGVILLLNALVVFAIALELEPQSRIAPLMAAAVAAFYFPLVFWSLRGMEVGALVLLIDLAMLLALRMRPEGRGRHLVLALILTTALIIRLDAAMQVAVVVAYIALTRRASGLQLAILLAIVAIAFAGILAFQQMYFGDFLPNTYYQKLGNVAVLDRAKAGILAFYRFAARDVLMLALVAAAGVWFYRHLQTKESALLGVLSAVQFMYSIWVGGDYAEPEVAAANRFITQGMVPLIILFSMVIEKDLADLAAARSKQERGAPGQSPVIAVVAAAATLAIISGTPWLDWAVGNAPLLKADIRRVRAGLAIAANTSEQAVIAVHAAGQIPYYSERRTIDLLGLNDPIIARGPRSTAFYPGHDKWNYAYSIGERRPDLIADNWIRLGDYIGSQADYRKLENGMYVRADSTLVDVEGLMAAYP